MKKFFRRLFFLSEDGHAQFDHVESYEIPWLAWCQEHIFAILMSAVMIFLLLPKVIFLLITACFGNFSLENILNSFGGILFIICVVKIVIIHRFFLWKKITLIHEKTGYIKEGFFSGAKVFCVIMPMIILSSAVVLYGLSLFLTKQDGDIQGNLEIYKNILSLAKTTSSENFQAHDIVNIGLMMISVGIIGPILEEIIYRGIIYRVFRCRAKMLSACVISALLFAFLHCNVLFFLQIFILGIFLALSYEKTRNIFTPIFCHIFFNLFNFLVICLL